MACRVCTFRGGYNEINVYMLCVASHSDKKSEREHTQRQHVKLFLGPTLQGDVRRRVKRLASNHMRTLITSWEEVDAIYQDFVQQYNCHASKSLTNSVKRPCSSGWGWWLMGRVSFWQSEPASEPCGGLFAGTLTASKELQTTTGWVIFILWWFGEGPKATWLTLSETGYWVSNGCQGTSRMT